MLLNLVLLVLLVFAFLAIFLICLIFGKVIECIVWPAFLDNIFLWSHSDSFFFMRFTKKDERVDNIFYEICEAAVVKGFKFGYPRIMITKPWVKPLFFEGRAYLFENMIVINGASLKKFSNSELSAVIAHEIGHLIDYQMEKEKHPFFTAEIKALEREKRAWAIAEYITSSEIVDNFFANQYNF